MSDPRYPIVPIIVRELSNPNQLDGGKTYSDLPAVFQGSTEQCVQYCESLNGYKWKSDSNIFGGYYAHPETGNCLFFT